MKAHCDKKDAWVTVANCITYDKENDDLPQELLHYDKGNHEGLEFPSSKLLMFMKLTDIHFKEYSTEEECNLFGSAITEIVKQ